VYPVVILTVQLFTIGNGTRQGGILSPYLFSRYIRELLLELETSRVCCCIGGEYINVLAYADDIVVIAPSWRGLQQLLSVLGEHSTNIDIACNVLLFVWSLNQSYAQTL